MKQRRAIYLLCLGLLAGGVAGCSGGADDPAIVELPPADEQPKTTPPATTPKAPLKVSDAWKSVTQPVGIWRGLTGNEKRNVLGVIFPGGELWMLYSVIGNPDRVGGIIRGNITTTGTVWEMKGAAYVDETYGTSATIDANGTWIPQQRLTGYTYVVAVPEDHERYPLYSEDQVELYHDERTFTPYDPAIAAGIYVGLWYPSEEVLIELKADGTIEGLSASGCQFRGEATPDGPVARGTVTFRGGPCTNGTATVSGVLGVSTQTGTLYAAGFNDERNRALLFIGRR